MSSKRCNKNGQSLIEILVAVGVGTIMLVGAITAFSPVIKSQTDVNRGQVGAALGAELLDNVRVFAEADWHNIDSLLAYNGECTKAEGCATYEYYLSATSSPFSVATGTETIFAASTTFYRDFYLTEVNRDSSGFIVGFLDGSNDPSTRLLTAEYWWGSVPAKTIRTYITRHKNRTIGQTDWIGGNINGPASSTLGIVFATSSNIDHSTTTGSIRILGI